MKLIDIATSRNDVGDTQVAFYFVHEGRTFAVAQRFSRNEHSYDVAQKLHLLEERIANVTGLVTGAAGSGSTSAAIVESGAGDIVGTTTKG